MAGVTLTTAQAQLQLWLDADAAVAKNQSYAIGNRSLTRANAAEITKKIDYWQGWVSRLAARAAGRSRTRYVVTQ